MSWPDACVKIAECITGVIVFLGFVAIVAGADIIDAWRNKP